jgi:hypothetical protein
MKNNNNVNIIDGVRSMRKKLSLLLFVFVMSWIVYTPVTIGESLKSININSLGMVSIPSNIEVSQVTSANGTTSTVLLVNDNNVWRTVVVTAVYTSNSSLENMTINNNRLKIISYAMAKSAGGSSRVLFSEPLKTVVVDGKKAYTASSKILLSTLAANMDYYFISKADGYLAVTFTSADSDSLFWRPIGEVIVNSAKE